MVASNEKLFTSNGKRFSLRRDMDEIALSLSLEKGQPQQTAGIHPL